MFTNIAGQSRKTGIAAAVLAASTLALASCAASAPPAAEVTMDPDEEATISLSFWGNDVRADMYKQVVDAFEVAHPNIDVEVAFLGPNEYWEKRATEAAGGGLPDVFAMDLAYLSQYAQNGTLLDLEPYLGQTIQTDTIDDRLLPNGVVNDVPVGVPISTNAWGMYINSTLLDELGLDTFDGGDWDDYYAWIDTVTEAAAAAGKDISGGSDPATRILNFELQLRADGGELFTPEGEPGFDEEDLTEFWESTAASREAQVFVPQQRLDETYPLTGFDSAAAASELTWDNTGSGYLGNLGEGYELELVAPPITKEGAKDMYLKASQLLSVSAKTDHPAAATMLVDFLINSPESGEIFGSNRGIPASTTALEAASLDGISAQIATYEESIADRLGEAPAVPAGYGSIYEKFRLLGEELGHGTITVDEAVSQFFTEMDVILAG